MNVGLSRIRDVLLERGRKHFESPRSFVEFAHLREADELINDLRHYPHAFVIGCIMDRRIKAEKAWQIPYRIYRRLRSFKFT